MKSVILSAHDFTKEDVLCWGVSLSCEGKTKLMQGVATESEPHAVLIEAILAGIQLLRSRCVLTVSCHNATLERIIKGDFPKWQLNGFQVKGNEAQRVQLYKSLLCALQSHQSQWIFSCLPDKLRNEIEQAEESEAVNQAESTNTGLNTGDSTPLALSEKVKATAELMTIQGFSAAAKGNGVRIVGKDGQEAYYDVATQLWQRGQDFGMGVASLVNLLRAA